MELTLPIISIPALVALVVKAGVYVYTRLCSVPRGLQTRLFLLFLLALATLNVAEITGQYVINVEHGLPVRAGELFVTAAVAAIAFLLHLATTIAFGEKTW